jgi:hypothetical protein
MVGKRIHMPFMENLEEFDGVDMHECRRLRVVGNNLP